MNFLENSDHLNTERLTLRLFTLSDAGFILTLLNTPGWLRFIGDRGIKTLSQAETYLQNVILPGYREFSFGFYLVTLKENNIPAGMCGLIKREGIDDVEIGFAFLPHYMGMGYAYESSLAVLKDAGDRLKLKKIAATTLSGNKSSILLLEKLGLRFTEIISKKDDPEKLLLYTMKLHPK